MPRKRKVTLGQIAIQRVGYRKAYFALGFTACWWIATSELGRPPVSADEYADWWKMSRATAFRDQAVFRTCFPECANPTELAAKVGYVVPKVKRDDKTTVLVDLIGLAAP